MVSDGIAITAISVIGGIVTLVVRHWLDRMDKKSELRAAEIKDQLTGMHKEFNGMKDALVKKAGELGEEKGHAAGVAEKQVEVDKLNKDSIPKRE